MRYFVALMLCAVASVSQAETNKGEKPELKGPAAILFYPPGEVPTATITKPPPVEKPEAVHPAIPLVGGDSDYPVLADNPDVLIADTEAILDSLPPLEIPPLDEDLLQLGQSYSISGGTGSLPGPGSERARCGVITTWRDGLVVPPPNHQPVCCVYDDQIATYRCGDPDQYPVNDGGHTLGPTDDPSKLSLSTVIHCDDFDSETLGGFESHGEAAPPQGGRIDNLTILESHLPHNIPTNYQDGTPLSAGSVCCVYSASSPNSDPLSCAPAFVSGGSGLGTNEAGSFQARTELFAEGTLSMFEERRDSAYSIDLAGRVSLISEIRGGADDAHIGRMRFTRLAGTYKRYFGGGPSPFFAIGGLDVDGMMIDIRKLAEQDVQFLYDLPGRVSLGFGFGRIYDIEPRIKMRKLEAMLKRHGVITTDLDHKVSREIMVAWWALRSEIGWDKRLLYTFKILRDHGLLKGAITPAVVYRFGQILNDSQLLRRRQGSDTRIVGRLGKRVTSGADGDFTIVAEIRDERTYNTTYDSELFTAPAIGIAPTKASWNDNTLPGRFMPFPGLDRGLVVVDAPFGYRMFDYDDYFNKMDALELRARVSIAYGNDTSQPNAPDGFNFAVGAGGSYTMFDTAFHGLGFTVDANIGLLDKNVVYAVVGGVSFVFATGEAYYVAPGTLGGELPFSLPLPSFVTGAP